MVYAQNVCHHVAFFLDSLYFDMQHDHVLRKLNFDLWTTSPGSGGGLWGAKGGRLRSKYLLP